MAKHYILIVMPKHRIEKINELIKNELSPILQSDFPGEIIVINFVATATDLSEAKIFLEISPDQRGIFAQINKNSWKYRRLLAKKLFLRKMPCLTFICDEMQGSIDRIEEILAKK